ncbi:MAG: hypothetical protein QXS48_03250 [Candidatus Aenigmatarchaeota archaeon]
MIAMTINFQRVWNWYSRESVFNALIEAGKNREVIPVYKDGSFGKRPDVIQYPQDVLQAVAEGAIAFHGSVERWSQPMKLDVGMTKLQLDELRIGWDIFIDPDVNDFEIAKITVKQIIEALKDHGVQNYTLKFSGGKGFHIGIPFESLPEKINFQPSQILYPELLQKVIEYIKWYIRDQLKEEILILGSPLEISKRVEKKLEEITDESGLDPFKVVSMDVFGSRHLFRLPYSLHESTLLVSLPIKPEDLEKFEREHALPEKVKVNEKFLVQKVKLHDAEALIVEALDWSAKHKIEVKEEIPKIRFKKIKAIPEEFFPPCVQNILKGLSDGRKRSVFILINFLKNMGWDLEKIEKTLTEWNSRNSPPLRANYLRTQIRWHLRQERNLLPPNCDNPNFYADIKVCTPDEFCKSDEKIVIKNPVNYPFKKLKIGKKKKRKKH